MEELLNKLIEKGWKPFDMEATRIEYRGGPEFLLRYKGRNKNGKGWNVRNLVSKESLLWQFVCENRMIKHDQYTNTTRIHEYEDERDSETCRKKYDEGSYLFRLIESTLKDESELEQFLLNNIKV